VTIDCLSTITTDDNKLCLMLTLAYESQSFLWRLHITFTLSNMYRTFYGETIHLIG